jgi:hypothetical protein
MKTRFKFFVGLIIVLTSCTNIIVKHVSSLKQPESSKHLVSYFLPKRVIEMKFTVEHQATEPSVFLKDSIALGAIIKSATGKEMVKKKTQKLVLKQVELNPISLADPEKLYSVDYRKFVFSKLEGNVSISEDGLIQTGTSSTESKTYQIIQTGLESIAGIVSNFIGIKKGLTITELDAVKGDSELKRAAIDLITKLKNVQLAKATLIASTIDMDSKLFETRLSILKEQEDALVQQLTGETSTKEYLFCKIWDPKPEEMNNNEIQKVFNMEFTLGKGGDTKLNIPVILVATVDSNLYNLIPKPQKSFNANSAESLKNKIGFYYNIPVLMTLKVYKEKISDFTCLNFIVNSKKQSSISLQMPQFGTVGFLPARLTKSDVKFYTDLGSIKEYSFTKDVTINPDEAKNISSSIDTVLSTINYLKSLKESVIEEKVVKTDESELYNVNITITPKEK